jgi:hypothetical protein
VSTTHHQPATTDDRPLTSLPPPSSNWAPRNGQSSDFSEALSVFKEPLAGFELLVPESWELRQDLPVKEDDESGEERLSRWVFGFGSGAFTSQAPALAVSVGNEEGAVFVCGYDDGCRSAVATTLDQLSDLLVSFNSFFPGTEVGGETTLLGDPGRFEHPQPINNCLGCPGKYHVYTIHDGRPVILSFDWWNIRFGRLGDGRALVGTILDSFQLLEP